MNRRSVCAAVVVLSMTACATDEAPSESPLFVRSALERSTDPQTDAIATAKQVEGNTDFAFDLYRALKSEEGNLFFSPFSITTAIAQAWAGANGATASEIAETLHFTGTQEATHAALNALDRDLTVDSEHLSVAIANALWASPKITPREEYLDVLALNYGAGVGVVDFSRTQHAVDTINAWVSEETRGTIPQLLTAEDLSGATTAVLTNTVDMRADWALPFEKTSTADATFTALDGSEHQVPMMGQVGHFPYTEGVGFQAAALPLSTASGRSYSLLVIKPTDFGAFEAGVDRTRLDAIRAQLQPANIALNVPKLEVRTSAKLKDALSALGMPTAFGDADFGGISQPPPGQIKNVIHQARLKLDEAGLEASAATAVIFGDASISEPEPVEASLVLDRPFLLAIVHAPSQSVLFLGRVTTL